MLLQDLQEFGKNARVDSAIINKCKADMVYYMVIEEIMNEYGTADMKKMIDFNADALGAARDQMAMMASDQGLVRYDDKDRVVQFDAKKLAYESFKNSEALRMTVLTHLASTTYKADSDVTDDAMFVRTDKEFEKILDIENPYSIINRVYAKIDAMERVSGGPNLGAGGDLYAMNMHAENVRIENQSVIKEYTGEILPVLKISPLMPEIRELRKIYNPYLDITADNEKYNQILMFDTQKKLLTIAHQDIKTYHEIPETDEFGKGIVLGNTDYAKGLTLRRDVIYEYEDEESDGNDDKRFEKQTKVVTLDPSYKIEAGLNTGFKWRMIHLLEKYSQRSLTESDIQIVEDMFDHVKDGTMFGTLEKDGYDAIMTNANLYFDYFEDMCKTVREKMSSHEFELHLRRVGYLEHATRGEDGMVVMLYASGERTADYNKSRSNHARHFGVYIYTDYTPVNLDVNPVIGDIAPASYNDYVIINRSMHVGDALTPEISNRATNPYAHATHIDSNVVFKMRATLDAYTSGSTGAVGKDIEIRKNMRKVGESDVDDLSKFINQNGTVRANDIVRHLIADLKLIKYDQRIKFRKVENINRFDNTLQRFIDEMDPALNEQPPRKRMYGAIVSYAEKHKNIRTMNDLQKSLKQSLYRHMMHELRNTYDDDMNSFTVSKHIFTKYINAYVDRCMDVICEANHIEDRNSYIRDLVSEVSDVRMIDANVNLRHVQEDIYKKMRAKNDDILETCLDDIFGKGEKQVDGIIDLRRKQNFIIKPNMCKHMSKTFKYDMYEDMLKLLSYSQTTVFEQGMGKSSDDIFASMEDTNANVTLQLYAADVYLNEDENTESAVAEDDVENTMEEENKNYNASFDDVMWYTSAFAKVNNENDKSWAWMVDHKEDAEAEKQRLIFKATHPLQYAAMEQTDRDMRNILGREYDANHLKMTNNGILYYTNVDNDVMFKIGPIIDERAYIRPYVVEDPLGDTEIQRPVIDENGYPVYDEHGKVLDETVTVSVYNDVIIENGEIKNEIVMGALDTPALTGDPNTVANRFYGISAKVANYDGYDHTGEKFTDRLEYHTYKTSVLNMLHQNLMLYAISKNKTVENQTPESILYTNVCANSLQKCYRTNTYIMEEKMKCKMADHFMSTYIDGDPYSILGDQQNDPVARKTLEDMSSLLMMQANMYHKRVVMPKIELNQNIGLYNQLLNLYQCGISEVYDRGGEDAIDRKNMRNSDMKSMRVAYCTPSLTFDSILSGTAKQLGAVAFLTDATKFNDLTGKLTIAPNATTASRCTLTSTGIVSFINGGIDCRLVNYPGGQAVDRMQLSANAIEKALNWERNVRFAMINLGYNMEDGYVVAKRAAHKFGHFSHDGKFHELVQWDKIGDTESGNKGVVAKIVDTSIGEGMSENDAERAFMKHFAKDFIQLHLFNHGSVSDKELSDEFKEALNKAVENVMYDKQGDTWQEKIDQTIVENNMTVADVRDMITSLKSSDHESIKAIMSKYQADPARGEIEVARQQAENLKRAEELQQKMDDVLSDSYEMIGRWLVNNKVEPFYGNYEMEHKLWQVFRDNPDLDLAVTNVCVLTRSNPSLLMYIGDALEKDKANGITADTIDVDNPQSESAIILRDENGNKYASMCACGHYNIYIDSHTSEDKQRDYTEASIKNGRGYGSQEVYALTAKHANDAFVKFITYNDPTLPDRVAKLNRRMIMNGFILDPNKDKDGNAFGVKRLSDMFRQIHDDSVLAMNEEISNGVVYQTAMLPGHSFIDMNGLAELITEKIVKNMSDAKYKEAIEDLVTDLDFTKLLETRKSKTDDELSTLAVEDMLKHIFVTSFGCYGGNFMMLPESLQNTSMTVYHHFVESKEDNQENTFGVNYATEDFGVDVYDDYDYGDMSSFYGDMYGSAQVDMSKGSDFELSHKVTVQIEDGEIVERKVAPLYMSSREILNADSETVTSNVDDNLQFKMFKTVMACAVIDRLHAEGKISDEIYTRVLDGWKDKETDEHVKGLRANITRLYEDISNPRNKSLDLKDMTTWLKKNIYKNVFPNSLTCVWSGNPTLEIDEAGLSFEKAKSLGLLRIKKDENGKRIDVRNIPDDYEHMHERYEPITDDDFVLINRSPGQTTGCIRAFRLRITGPDGDGLQVHPACATIFDGDFDGDTIGVINPRLNMNPRMSAEEKAHFRELAAAAYTELGRTMSMQANMVHTADYTDVSYTNAKGETVTIVNVNPLFIAGNADIAIAKHSMMQKDANGEPSCGYDVNKELERIQVMANIIEQFKQCRYDKMNYESGKISSETTYDDIVKMRVNSVPHAKDGCVNSCIMELYEYFACDPELKHPKTQRDVYWSDMFDKMSTLIVDNMDPKDAVNGTVALKDTITTDAMADIISSMEKQNKERLTKVYREMTGYISKNPLYTHGDSQVEMLANIIRDANISKKGKVPQLNALLVFSGTHQRCGGDLIVVESKENGKKAYELRQVTDEYPEGVKIDLSSEAQKELMETVKLSHKNAQSDVPISKHRTQIESNIAAQSDKSDATGLGGGMAQKMQKLFAAKGYGELGLRISGPITQIFLDAKQNVTKCEKNLKVGKFILDKVCKFEYVHELSNEYLQTACPEQVYNGQYTFKRNVTKVDEKTGEVSVVKDKDTGEIVRKKKYMTVDESIEQLDNFLKVMGQPAFSEIDKVIVRSVLEQFTTVDREGKQVVKNPIKKADKECDITYSAMYDGNKHFLTVLKNMADNKRTLWSGSAFYDGKVDTDRIIREHVLDNQPKDIRKQVISNIEDYIVSGTEAEKESVVARNTALEQEVKAMQEATTTFASRDDIDDEKREKAKTVINSRMAALKQRAAKAEEAVAAGKSVTTIPVKENTEEKTENKVLKVDVRTIKPNEDPEEIVDKTPAD